MQLLKLSPGPFSFVRALPPTAIIFAHLSHFSKTKSTKQSKKPQCPSVDHT